MTKKQNNKNNNFLFLMIGLIIVLAAVVVGSLLYRALSGGEADSSSDASSEFSDESSNEVTYESRANNAPSNTDSSEVIFDDNGGSSYSWEGDSEEKNIDWEALKAQNSDIYAWIEIPGTTIDGPIMQHNGEKTYYDTHNADGDADTNGAIHSDIGNSLDFMDPNTVIYGNSSTKGTQFADLIAYGDSEFFNKSPYVYIYTPDRTIEYRIFAAYPSTEEDILRTYNLYDYYEFDKYLTQIYSIKDMNAVLDWDVKDSIEATGFILTLSTKEADKAGTTFIVQAVMCGEE